MEGLRQLVMEGGERELSAHWVRVLNVVARKRVLVGFIVEDGCVACGIEDDHALDPDSEWFRPGCLTKLLTAALCMQAVRENVLLLDDPVVGLLPRHAAITKCLPETLTVRHLLEHTHGLDDSGIESGGCSPGTALDVIHLCERLAVNPVLAPPGRLYSYSRVGSWLLASILEHQTRKPYAQILDSWLTATCGSDGPHVSADRVCPAEGAQLSIRFKDMLAFLRFHLGPASHFQPNAATAASRIAVTPLPGWAPQEKGVWLGWKAYGSGWFGHTSVLRGSQSLVRIHPQKKMGLLLVSRDQAVSAVSIALFGRLIPELHSVAPHSSSEASGAERGDGARYAGTYANAALTSTVTPLSENTLEIRVESAQAPHQPRWTGSFRRAGASLLFVGAPGAAPFSFVQFVGREPESFRYMWDGRQIYPRRAVAQSAGSSLGTATG